MTAFDQGHPTTVVRSSSQRPSRSEREEHFRPARGSVMEWVFGRAQLERPIAAFTGPKTEPPDEQDE
jgi:hypothetical protein